MTSPIRRLLLSSKLWRATCRLVHLSGTSYSTSASTFTALPRVKLVHLSGTSYSTSTSTSTSTSVALPKVWLDSTGQYLEVEWVEAGRDKYPLVYLRDCCKSSFSPHTNSRSTLLENLDVDVKAEWVEVDEEGKEVVVRWREKEEVDESRFSFQWLRDHSFSQGARRKHLYSVYKSEPKLWDSQWITENLKKFKFSRILEDDQVLFEWIKEVEEVGLSIITETPCEEGQLHVLGDRVAYLKTSYYGPTFHVRSKYNPTNLAYTSGKLGFHTDLAATDYSPGIQMLHCIKQSMSGGDNILGDGFLAANIMKCDHPDQFKLLTEVVVDFADVNDDYIDFHMMGKHRVIELDEHGEVDRINFHVASRSTYLDVPVEKVIPLYRALKNFDGLLNSPRCLFKYRMEEGDIACFNNIRVLHGREPYETGDGGERWLEGGYFDTDNFRSTFRVLKQKYGHIPVMMYNNK